MITIYALTDPETNMTIYVGATKHPIKKRMAQHVRGARYGTKMALYDWMRANGEPKHAVLDVVEDGDGEGAEQRWIKSLRESGATLLNVAAGGRGFCGAPRTEDHNLKIKAALTGKKHTAERRANIGASLKGKRHQHTDETKAKIGAAHKGREFSAEHRANIATAAKTRVRAPHTTETKAKMAAARAAFWAKKRGSD